MKKKQMSHLFERFYQAGGSLSRTHSGSGLGLAITKQLLELQGGSISVKSVFGKGSTFTISVIFNNCEDYEKIVDNNIKPDYFGSQVFLIMI